MDKLSTVWSRIPPMQMNRALSSDYLDVLEPLLGRTGDDVPLKDDRVEKSQIYKMTVLGHLGERGMRRELFKHMPSDELRYICRELEIATGADDLMRRKLTNVRWGQNPKAARLAKFLGVPDFVVDIEESDSEGLPNEVCPWVCKHAKYLHPVKEDKLTSQFSNRAPFKTLKSYQAIALQKVMQRLRPNFQRCILNMPTGTGKTRTAMEAVCTYLVEHPTHSVVWVAHTTELIDQAAHEFIELWEFLGDRPLPLLRRQGRRASTIGEQPAFVVTSFQTLLGDAKAYVDGSVGLIVVDEAHMTMGVKWSKSIESIVDPKIGTRILGLTATPVRTGADQTGTLIDFYKQNLVQLESESDENVFEFLIGKGILAQSEYHKLRGASVRISDSAAKKIEENNSDLPNDLIQRLARDGSRNLEIVDKLKEILGPTDAENQILFFAASTDHSKMITVWLLKNGYSAFHLDASVGSRTRGTAINAFRQGKLRVLCNYGVLSTGFDAPKVDCVFIARPTTSHVLHSQMVGRGLRGPEIGGTDACTIVEVEDNIENFASDAKVSFQKYLQLWQQAS